MSRILGHPVAFLIHSASTGWVAMIAAFAVYIFLLPHGPHFAPEVGPLGAFIIFGIMLSGFYIVDFVFLAIPSYYFFWNRKQPPRRWQCVLCGAVLFLCSVPLWLIVCGGHGTAAGILLYAVLAVIAGAASFYVLSPTNAV
jgi:hypothetical protein